VKDIDIPWIVRNMVGHEASVSKPKPEPERFGEELLRVEGLTLPGRSGGFALENISFSLRKGEILGIYGLLGSGRTEILECLMGMHPEATADIYLEGKKIKARSIREQIERGFAHVPEDRQREGLVQTLSVAKNITLSSLNKYARWFHLVQKKEEEHVRNTIEDLYIKVADSNLPVLSLSGGNQQKVVIGKGILTGPKVLLLDEPSRGIDVGAKAEVFELIRRFASQGLGIILVASELKEIVSISDRVIVLSNGRLTGEFAGEQITEEALVLASAEGQRAIRV